MSDDARLMDLVVHWEELHSEGHDLSPEELCRSCPELLEPLRRQIQALRDLNVVLEAPSSQATSAWPGQADPVADTLASAADRAVARSPAAPAKKPLVEGYDILGELGRGGMGVVYKARHVKLNRVVALKMILAGSHAGTEELARFKSEAEAVARLQHPNIVQIYEIGESEGNPFCALEYVDGGSLDDQLAGKPQPAQETAQLVETLARAMHYAHQRGIVHRDLKPGNILLDCRMPNADGRSQPHEQGIAAPQIGNRQSAFGNPKITDFGLAKQIDDPSGPTASGTILGTPSYMAPEQADGKLKDIGPATDVYALGALLYEMLTGRPPFQADTAWDTILQVKSEEPVTLRRLQSKVPQDLETICLKCLRKEPARRYASALALAEDLRRFLDGEPILARPVGLWVRAVKWVKRRPAVAALLAVSCLAAIALGVGGIIYNIHLQRALQTAETYAEESRQRLVRLHVTEGTHCLDEGDWFGSLVWFAEALHLDQGHPAREEMHRVRIAGVLQQCPRLVQFWFHNGPVRHAEFSPNGRYVITASEDKTAQVWNVRTGEPVCPSLQHPQAVLYAAFSPDSRSLVTAGRDGKARVWAVSTGRPRFAPCKHAGPVLCAAFSRNGRWIVTAAGDGTARVWNAATGKPLTASLQHKGAVRHAAFSPDSRLVVTASEDRTARVWHTDTGQPATPPLRHAGAVTYAAFDPAGRHVATASADKTARLWEVSSGKPVGITLRHRAAVVRVSFSPEGGRVLTASDDHTACVWQAETGELLTPPLRQGSGITSAVFSSDGQSVVTASDNNTARVWDAATGEPATPLLRHNGTVHCAEVSPDGRLVITAGNDDKARLWDVAFQRRLLAISKEAPADQRGPDKPATPWLSSDHRWEVTPVGDHSAQVRERETGKLLGPPLKHGSAILHAAFSPAGHRLVTASEDNTALIWDIATGKLLTQPLKHNGSIYFAAFSPHGRRVVTASIDKTARVWDAATGEPLTPPLKFTGTIRHVSFAEDGFLVRVASTDRSVWTWDLRPDDRPVKDLQNLAQVLGGSQVDPTRGLLPLGSSRLRNAWQLVRSWK